MYSTALGLALASLLVAGAALAVDLGKDRQRNAWRNTALAAGLLADVLVTLAAAWHFAGDHGAASVDPMTLGPFVAGHPAVIAVALGANLVIAASLFAPGRH